MGKTEKHWRSLVLASLVAGLFSIPGFGSPSLAAEVVSPAACEASAVSPPLSELISVSDFILTATPQVDGERLLAAARADPPEHMNIRLVTASAWKGHLPDGDLFLRIFPREMPYSPPNAALIAAASHPNLIFLTQVDQFPGALYFAGYTPAALQSDDPARLDAIVREIARQRRILDHWRSDPHSPHTREVAQLIEELVALAQPGHGSRANLIEAQQEIFRRIEALGSSAVPAIIDHMDDRRRIAVAQISLLNRNPDAFEAMRHYGPELVVDAMDAILNQITGKFGRVFNSGSDRERRAAVDAWRIYAAGIRCSGASEQRRVRS